MNNDLISRSALLEAIAEEFFKTDPTGEEQLGYLACSRIVREFPTVDAEVVRHGRWLNKTERIYADLNYRFDCSVCSHIFYAAGIETFNYCPNCGAKMRGNVDASE